MDRSPDRWKSRLALPLGVGLALSLSGGCSERPKPAPHARASDFRKIRFAAEWVVVTFRGGLPTASVPEPTPQDPPQAGDRVVLSDLGPADIFLASDLDSLQFYHSSPGPEQLDRFRKLAEDGKLFVVARGTTAVVAKVVEGALPDNLRALELRLSGEAGGIAWVSETFARRVAVVTK